MRRFLTFAAAGLVTALLFGAASQARADEEASCHGTSVRFVDTPSEAARDAKKGGKLVLVLHISGNFENPNET